MKRLIYLILLIIHSVILYTCKSPVAIDTTTLPNDLGSNNYYSSVTIISDIYLGISINLFTPTITIGFVNNNSTGTIVSGDRIDSANTNIISGTYPYISFQNDDIFGTITFFETNQIKITFQKNNSPYFKMQDVICKTSQ